MVVSFLVLKLLIKDVTYSLAPNEFPQNKFYTPVLPHLILIPIKMVVLLIENWQINS